METRLALGFVYLLQYLFHQYTFLTNSLKTFVLNKDSWCFLKYENLLNFFTIAYFVGRVTAVCFLLSGKGEKLLTPVFLLG